MKKPKRFLKDNIASIIFTSNDCIEYVERIVSAALGIDELEVKGNLTLITPRISENINIKGSNADAVYESDTSIINIEVNYNITKESKMKNLRYVCQLLLKQTKPNEKINLKPIIQININNYDIFDKKEFIYRSFIMEEKYHLKRDDTISIIDINVDLLSEIDYTNIKGGKDSLEYLLYIFVNENKSELSKLYSSDKIMKKVEEKMSALSEDFLDGLYYDVEEYHKKVLSEVAYEEGIKKGAEEATANTKKEIVKAMLKDNALVDTIVKYTGLNQKEIDIIKKELDKDK